MTSSLLFNTAGNRNSVATEVQEPGRFEPTTRQVVEAGALRGFDAPGSFTDDFVAAQLNREFGNDITFMQKASEFVFGSIGGDDDPGPALTREEYESGPYFREEIKFQEGMTNISAALLADRVDLSRS